MPDTGSKPVPAGNGLRYAGWVLLALPAAIQCWRYWQGTLFYGEFIHWSGVLATQLLIATLAITPLRLAFPRARIVRRLVAWRRYLGVATFGYAALHTGCYLLRQYGTGKIAEEALTLEIGSGWLALAVFAVLAATSNDTAVRALGRNWKTLHRAVYVAALLTFLHWILTAFDPRTGFTYLAVFVALQATRLGLKARNARRLTP